jgi:hypothetical protein
MIFTLRPGGCVKEDIKSVLAYSVINFLFEIIVHAIDLSRGQQCVRDGLINPAI